MTFDSVTKQQDNQIDDLQREISKLQARTEALEGSSATTTRGGDVNAASGQNHSAAWQGGRPEPRLPVASGVLWVDDHPENNAIQIDRLERNRVFVDTARSTEEAAEKLRGRRYQSIISDMGRSEHGRSVPDAGVQLVEDVRRYNQDTPVLIYASPGAVQTYGPRAKAAGANLATSSPLELAEELRRAGLL